MEYTVLNVQHHLQQWNLHEVQLHLIPNPSHQKALQNLYQTALLLPPFEIHINCLQLSNLTSLLLSSSVFTSFHLVWCAFYLYKMNLQHKNSVQVQEWTEH